MAVIDASLAMMPRLDAQEALEAVVRLGVGTGAYKAEDQRARVKAWQRAAHPDRAAAVVKPSASDLRAIGIKVVRTKKRKAQAHG